jgi:ferredoxin
VTISVDSGMCMGVRSCVQIAPQSFTYGPGHVAHGVIKPADDLDTVLEAAAACPNFAITVEVDGEIVFDPDLA